MQFGFEPGEVIYQPAQKARRVASLHFVKCGTRGYAIAVPGRKVARVIRAATKDDVTVCEAEVEHARRHFPLPRDLLLDLIERVLTRPTLVYADDARSPREYRLFYRLEDGRYILVVVKVTAEGAFFASMYPTGRRVRAAHGKFRRLL
jgi:hypothetical protein